MRDPVRLGQCAAVAAVVGLLATALHVERLLGSLTAPTLVFHVDVPLDALTEMSAPAIEATWRGRMRPHDVRTAVEPPDRPGSVGVRVSVHGAGADDAEGLAGALVSRARLEILPVLDGDPLMSGWYQAVTNGEVPGLDPQVSASPETWSDERGHEFFDSYLHAPTADALDRAVERLSALYPVPDGKVVLVEELRAPPGLRGGGDEDLLGDGATAGFRTYLVSPAPIVTSDDVAGAEVTFDPNTGRPEVLVTFDRDGARRFGDATAELVGHKLAIVIDGHVESAPVVQGPIRGGRSTISMGGADPRRQHDDAVALAGALRSRGHLPAGLVARLVETHDQPVALVWLIRALTALLAAALAWSVAAIVERRRWFQPAPDLGRATAAGPGAAAGWHALVVPVIVTAAIPALLWWLAGRALLPGINEVEVANVTLGSSPAMFGVLALGITPVAAGFVLVELAAILVELLVPARRGRRLGTPTDRRRLDRAAWIVVAALALLQAYFVAQYLDGMVATGVEVFRGGAGARWLVVLSLTAGVMVQVIAAEAISRHGLCNGYLALLGAAALTALTPSLVTVAGPQVGGALPTLTFVAIAAAAAVAVVLTTRLRGAGNGPRLPYTGAVPASFVRGGIAMVSLAALWSSEIAVRIAEVRDWAPLADLAAALPFTALILWMSPPRARDRAGVVVTAAFVALLVTLPLAVAEPYRVAVPVSEGVLLGALAVELWVGARARLHLPHPTTVLVVHDVERADTAADLLAAAAIPHAMLGGRARAALRCLGAFAPIAVQVPAGHAAAASALLAGSDADDVAVGPHAAAAS